MQPAASSDGCTRHNAIRCSAFQVIQLISFSASVSYAHTVRADTLTRVRHVGWHRTRHTRPGICWEGRVSARKEESIRTVNRTEFPVGRIASRYQCDRTPHASKIAQMTVHLIRILLDFIFIIADAGVKCDFPIRTRFRPDIWTSLYCSFSLFTPIGFVINAQIVMIMSLAHGGDPTFHVSYDSIRIYRETCRVHCHCGPRIMFSIYRVPRRRIKKTSWTWTVFIKQARLIVWIRSISLNWVRGSLMAVALACINTIASAFNFQFNLLL